MMRSEAGKGQEEGARRKDYLTEEKPCLVPQLEEEPFNSQTPLSLLA